MGRLQLSSFALLCAAVHVGMMDGGLCRIGDTVVDSPLSREVWTSCVGLDCVLDRAGRARDDSIDLCLRVAVVGRLAVSG